MQGKKHFGLCDMQIIIHCSLFIFFIGVLGTLSFYRNGNQLVAVGINVKVTLNTTNKSTTKNHVFSNVTRVFDDKEIMRKTKMEEISCDLFSGRWVYDNDTYYPLYKENECPYIEDSFACKTYGRKDSKYLQWRWQPHGCDFPRFDGKAVIERLRGKRLLFVGDSLNRNQWNSMICMLHSSIPGMKKAGGALDGLLHTFRATDYNISVDFYWAPMLVESSGDNPTDHHRDDRIVAIKAIEKHARHWVNADIVIFNSYHWWRSPIVKLQKRAGSLLDEPNEEYEEVDSRSAYKMGLETWSNWVRNNVNHSKTKLFFMGVTATHSKARDWGGMKKGNCYGETEPVMDDGFWERRTDPQMLNILESSLSKLKANGINIQIINITQLTQYRKDAHTTVYRKYWRPLTELQIKSPHLAADCSHWCLPGVPEIWNELLSAYIFR